MKQTPRNLFVFGTIALTALAASGGCSSSDGPALGSGNTTFGGSTSTAGTFTAAGTGGTGVVPSGGTGTAGTFGTGTAGTFGTGTAGTFGTGTAGTFGAAGTDAGGTGGTGTAGTGGAGTAGTAAGGTAAGGTSGGDDFPAGCPAPTGTHATDKLTKTCWKASATACSLGNNVGLVNPPKNVLDADLMSRYATGDKMVTSKQFMFDVDMGKAVMINGISTSTLTATDIPPQIEVDVSTDGTAWTPVACGPNSPSADISFAAVSARYVRLVQHGTADAWWSMVDLEVYRSAADDTCGAGATTTACTSIGAALPDTCCGVSHVL